jgi:hypothetical protein
MLGAWDAEFDAPLETPVPKDGLLHEVVMVGRADPNPKKLEVVTGVGVEANAEVLE